MRGVTDEGTAAASMKPGLLEARHAAPPRRSSGRGIRRRAPPGKRGPPRAPQVRSPRAIPSPGERGRARPRSSALRGRAPPPHRSSPTGRGRSRSFSVAKAARGCPAWTASRRDENANWRQCQQPVKEGLYGIRLGQQVIVVENEDCSGRPGFEIFCEEFGKWPGKALRRISYAQALVNPLTCARHHRSDRLRESGGERADVGGCCRGAVPGALSFALKPFSGERRLPVPGRGGQQDRLSSRPVQKRRQPWPACVSPEERRRSVVPCIPHVCGSRVERHEPTACRWCLPEPGGKSAPAVGPRARGRYPPRAISATRGSLRARRALSRGFQGGLPPSLRGKRQGSAACGSRRACSARRPNVLSPCGARLRAVRRSRRWSTPPRSTGRPAAAAQ